MLSGSTSNVEENQTVIVTFGGKSYTATVDADGNAGPPPYRPQSRGPERRRCQRRWNHHAHGNSVRRA